MLVKPIAAALLIALTIGPASAALISIPTTTIKLDCQIKQQNGTLSSIFLSNHTQQAVHAGAGVQVTSNSGKTVTLVMAQEVPAGSGWNGQNLKITGRTCTAHTVMFNAQ